MKRDKSIVGDLINFRGLVYSPLNENGVIFIFGKVIEDLNMYIEEIRPGFPDCVGRRFTGKGWEQVLIEFEYRSSNFLAHGHNPKECDIIVCWEHDWPDCPIEVIELKEMIKTLPNNPIQRPDLPTEEDKYNLEDYLKNFSDKVRHLFNQFDEQVKNISDEIWSKPTSRGVTYYSPERVFIYADFQKQGLRLTVFTRGYSVNGVKSLDYSKGGEKWGRVHLRDEAEMNKVLEALKKSRELIREAIRKNEPTGWYAKIEEEEVEGEASI